MAIRHEGFHGLAAKTLPFSHRRKILWLRDVGYRFIFEFSAAEQWPFGAVGFYA